MRSSCTTARSNRRLRRRVLLQVSASVREARHGPVLPSAQVSINRRRVITSGAYRFYFFSPGVAGRSRFIGCCWP